MVKFVLTTVATRPPLPKVARPQISRQHFRESTCITATPVNEPCSKHLQRCNTRQRNAGEPHALLQQRSAQCVGPTCTAATPVNRFHSRDLHQCNTRQRNLLEPHASMQPLSERCGRFNCVDATPITEGFATLPLPCRALIRSAITGLTVYEGLIGDCHTQRGSIESKSSFSSETL